MAAYESLTRAGHQEKVVFPEEAPHISYVIKGGWKVWARMQATQSSRSGIPAPDRRWSEENGGLGGQLIPEKFVPHSGRIGGATRLGAK